MCPTCGEDTLDTLIDDGRCPCCVKSQETKMTKAQMQAQMVRLNNQVAELEAKLAESESKRERLKGAADYLRKRLSEERDGHARIKAEARQALTAVLGWGA